MGTLFLFPLWSEGQNISLICFNHYCGGMVAWGQTGGMRLGCNLNFSLTGWLGSTWQTPLPFRPWEHSNYLHVGRQSVVALFLNCFDDVNLSWKNFIQPYGMQRATINQKIIWGGGLMFGWVIQDSQGSTQELYSLFCSVNKASARLFSVGKKSLWVVTHIGVCVDVVNEAEDHSWHSEHKMSWKDASVSEEVNVMLNCCMAMPHGLWGVEVEVRMTGKETEHHQVGDIWRLSSLEAAEARNSSILGVGAILCPPNSSCG